MLINTNNKTKVNLSPTAIQAMEDCQCCFWWDKKMKVKRPSFPFPRILNKIDSSEKSFYDSHRANKTIPDDLNGLGARLFEDQSLLNKWRDFRGGGLKYEWNGNSFMGLVDDVLISNNNNKLIPFDFKTVGDAGNSQIYQNHKIQLSSYCYLFTKLGFEVESFGILCFRYPTERVSEDLYSFGTEIVRVDPLRPETVERAINKAIRILASVEPPPSNPNCIYCNYKRRN